MQVHCFNISQVYHAFLCNSSGLIENKQKVHFSPNQMYFPDKNTDGFIL